MRLVAMVMLITSACRADVVVTSGARVRGALLLDASTITVDQKAIALDQVLYLLRPDAKPTISAAQLLRMKSGEIWPVELMRLSGRKLKVNSPVFGAREIDLAEVAAIEFVLRPALPAVAAGTLYRQQGDPVPGKLLWVDAARIAIESPLGVLNLPRQGSLSYVIDAGSPPVAETGEDQLRLIDGSVFRGQVMVVGGRIELKHRLLGTLSLPLESIRMVQRQPAGVVYVDQPVVQAVSVLTGTALPAEPGDSERITLAAASRWAVKIAEKANGGRLRLFIGPMGDSRADVRVRCRLSDKVIWEKIISAGQAGEELALPLTAGELVIEADFASLVRFPSGVVLERPMVMLAK